MQGLDRNENVCFWLMNIPERYGNKLLKNFKGEPSGLREAIVAGESLLLSGGCGTGKTHLAVGLAKYWVGVSALKEKEYYAGRDKEREFTGETWEKRVYFLSALEFFFELKNTFDGSGSEAEVLSKYDSVTLLVIDDLGAEKVSDWSRQMMFLLIDRRYRDCKQTIITTNLAPDKLAKEIDDRIMSRICEMGRVVILTGPDKRIKTAAGGEG